MPFTLTMPKLSPTMETGTIVKWHKKVGDFVAADELLFEVATDKATVEYNALDSGWIAEIIVKNGGEAIVNQAIAIFTGEKGESIKGYKPEGLSPASAAEKVEKPIPVSAEVAPTGGSGSTTTSVRQVAFTPEPPVENYVFHYPDGLSSSRVKASPLARKLAKQQGLDLSTVKGTGPGNRIVERDLVRAQKNGVVAFGRRETPTQKPGSYVEESLSQMRKVISQRLQDAKASIPHFYVSMKIDAQALVDTREQLRQVDVKVTFNDFIVRACALALRKHPQVNSGFNSVTNSIVRFQTIDISVAVSLPTGLITPIVRHADFKNLGELSLEVRELASRAKEGKLEPQEYKGGSFTISNLGMYGVSDFCAIINPPQAAILAVSGILDTPVVRHGKIVPGKEITLTLSGDHRVIDGVVAAEFLQTLQKLLENPASLLM